MNNVYIERHKKIGSGGFSNVYKVVIHPMNYASKNLDNLNKDKKLPMGPDSYEAALKYVSMSQLSGLESQMESYIMKYVIHPSINKAYNISINSNGSTNIYQKLSLGDASFLLRKSFNKVSKITLKRWLWQISCGVAKLHSIGIIHGDIKAGNLLVFQKDKDATPIPKMGNSDVCKQFDTCTISLNDFSLSRLIKNSKTGTKDIGGYVSFTTTHRPIEVWKNLPYSFPADIWALGCTFYQLKYGQLLFPEKKREYKQYKKTFALQSIEAWNNFVESSVSEVDSPDSPIPRSKSINSSAHIPILNNNQNVCYSRSAPLSTQNNLNEDDKQVFIEPNDWHDKENESFNNLLIGMLNINQNNRLTIWDILEDEYFDEIRNEHDMAMCSIPVEDRRFVKIKFLLTGISKDIIKKCRIYTSDQDVIELAISIYQRCNEKSNGNNVNISITACIIVAHKLIYRCPPENVFMSNQLKEEIKISKILNCKFIP